MTYTVAQVVQVAFATGTRSYAYRWQGSAPLDVGDVVTVPSNEVTEEPQPATVVAFGRGGYEGPLAELLGRWSDGESE